MRKKITAIILSAILAFSLMPFSIVKAGTSLTNATSGSLNASNGLAAGYYYVYTATSSSGSYLQFYFNDKIYDYDQYHAASITDIQLNDQYDGYITLSFNSSANLTSKLVFIESDGACAMNYSTQAINLTVNDCEHITVYVFTIDSTANNIQPTSISPTLQKSSFNVNLDPVLQNQIIQHWFPNENLTGYLWGISYGPLILNFNNTNIPVFYILRGDNVYQNYHRLDANVGVTQEFYFFYDWWLTNERIRLVTDPSNIDISYNIEVILRPGTTQTGVYNPYYLHKLTVINNTSTFKNYEFEIIGHDGYLTPLFYGIKGQIPDYLSLLLGLDYNNTYTRLLQDIVNALNGQNNPTNPSTDINNTADELTDLHDQENQIVSDFHDDLTDFNTNMDLTGYDFITGLNNSNNYFKMLLDQMYVESSSIRAFWIIPLILVILTVLLGR